MLRHRGSVAVLGFVLLASHAPSAGASLREFESWQVEAAEQDDENTLDAIARDYPLAWQREWARLPSGVRTTMGCVTTELWDYQREMRARAALSRWLEARFDHVRERSLGSDFENPELSLWLRALPALARPQGEGWMPSRLTPRLWGIGFRPAFEKAVMALSLRVATDADTSAHLAARLSLEDVWNSQFDGRSQVGETRVTYLASPVEYEIGWVIPYDGRRELQAAFKSLTPSSREIRSRNGAPQEDHTADLEGWRFDLHAALELGAGWSAECSARRRSADAARQPLGAASLVVPETRSEREEAVFPGVYRRLGSAWRARAGVLWRRATEHRVVRPGGAEDRLDFESREIVSLAALAGQWRSGAGLEVGFLHDDIHVDRRGDFGGDGARYGTRSENRVFVALEWMNERARIRVVEGIELDREPYRVTWRHDKAALALQLQF